MAFHSRRGPSQAKKFRACPGSLAMADAVPPNLRLPHGDAARLGTATHAVIEHCLKHGKAPRDLEGRIILIIEKEDEGEGCSILREGAKLPKTGVDEYVFIVDDDMINNADVAVYYVRERCAELGITEADLELETRTNPIIDRDDTSGTADITIPATVAGVLEVIDYKNGYLLVEAVDNDQARAYLLGKAIEYDWAFDTYRAGIIQPNSPHADGPIRVQEYTQNELIAFMGDYDDSIQRCEEAEAAFANLGVGNTPLDHVDFPKWADKYLSPGDHCTFCQAGATCPKRREEAERQAKIDFASPPGEIQLPAVATPGVPVEASELQVARILAWAPFLDDLVRAAKIYAHRAMEAGYEIPGQKLVRARTNRKLIDGNPREIAKQICDGGFVHDEASLFTRKMKTGPQIEKLVPPKKRKAFNDLFLDKPEGGTVVAPVDDPRPAVIPHSVGEDFDALEDQTDEFDFG